MPLFSMLRIWPAADIDDTIAIAAYARYGRYRANKATMKRADSAGIMLKMAC